MTGYARKFDENAAMSFRINEAINELIKKAPCKCLSIIMLDSFIKANTKYYPQTLLEKCKYVQEKIKTENHIDEDLEKSESDSDSNDETESDIDNDEYDK